MSCNNKIFSKRWPTKYSEISPEVYYVGPVKTDVFLSLWEPKLETLLISSEIMRQISVFCLQGLFSQLHLHMADSEPVWTFLWKTKQSSFEKSQTGLQKDGVRCQCSTCQRTGKIANLVGNDCLFFLIPIQLLVTRENVPSSSWNRSFKAQAWLLHEAHECHQNPRLSHEIYAHLTALRVATRVSQEALRWITYGGTTLYFPVFSIYSIYTCTANHPVHFHTWNPSRRADTTLGQCEEGGLQSGLQGLQLRG